MSFNFRESAIANTTLSPLMEGRSKISTADVKRDYKDGITINAVDMMNGADKRTGEAKEFAVIQFAENDEVFLFAGKVLSNIVFGWLEAYKGDVKACNADLKAAGGVKVKLETSRTKDGNDVTTVTVI